MSSSNRTCPNPAPSTAEVFCRQQASAKRIDWRETETRFWWGPWTITGTRSPPLGQQAERPGADSRGGRGITPPGQRSSAGPPGRRRGRRESVHRGRHGADRRAPRSWGWSRRRCSQRTSRSTPYTEHVKSLAERIPIWLPGGSALIPPRRCRFSRISCRGGEGGAPRSHGACLDRHPLPENCPTWNRSMDRMKHVLHLARSGPTEPFADSVNR